MASQGRRVYLDHAATSPLRPEAAAAMAATGPLANPAAVHASGRRARAMLDDAREQIAALLGARPLELVFTSGGTEADNIAVLGAARADERGRAVEISGVEHAAIQGLAAPGLLGDRARVLPVDRCGRADPDSIGAAGPVGAVSVMAVNNETGTLQPLAACAEAAHRAGALFHTDAVQALGHIPVDLGGWGADMASFSAHKIGGPVGIGVLWRRRGISPAPVGAGGGQEAGLRSGTQTVALARGFAAALERALAELPASRARWRRLRRRICRAAAAVGGVTVDGGDGVSPAICHLTVAGARGDDMALLLDRAGIDCSTGSACHAGVSAPSQVMIAMGATAQQASSCLRFSMGPGTGDDEVDRLVEALPTVVARARGAR